MFLTCRTYHSKRGLSAPGVRDDWRPLLLDAVRNAISGGCSQCAKATLLRAAQVLGFGGTSLYRYLKDDGYDQAMIGRVRAAGDESNL